MKIPAGNRAYHHQVNQDGPQDRQGDVPGFLEGIGAFDQGHFVVLFIDGLQRRQNKDDIPAGTAPGDQQDGRNPQPAF